MKRQMIIVLATLAIALSSSATAIVHVENFEYAKPVQNDFVNGIFQHSIQPPLLGQPGSESWDISDYNGGLAPHSGNALDLWPAIDVITFDLAPGEYVDYVAIEFSDWANSTTFEVTGTLGAYSVELLWTGGTWESADTTGQSLGEITQIRLITDEGLFDNLTINVVPEPATIGLVGLGGLSLIRRKRKE